MLRPGAYSNRRLVVHILTGAGAATQCSIRSVVTYPQELDIQALRMQELFIQELWI